MKSTRLILVVVFYAFTSSVLAGCSNEQQQSSSGATQKTSAKIPLNKNGLTVEQQNIEDRVQATMDPAKVMWIHLIGLDGKIIRRMPVRNKVTSSGKRLEPVTASGTADGYSPNSPFKIPGNNSYFNTGEFIQPDGTYGSSDAYIFWFDPMGRYHQWGTAGGLGYLMTDYPIDLANQQDVITGMFNMDAAASAWQKQQEARLQAAEAATGK